jgi:hypothetical protein
MHGTTSDSGRRNSDSSAQYRIYRFDEAHKQRSQTIKWNCIIEIKRKRATNIAKMR